MARKTFLAAAMVAVLSAACGKKPAEAPKPASAPPAEPAASAPAPAAAPSAGPTIAKFRFGTAFGADGTVSAETAVLGAGDPACTSFDVTNAPADARVRVAWIHQPDKKAVARDEAPLPSGKPSVSFKSDTKSWPAGDYVMEISLLAGDQPAFLGTTTFKLQRDRAR